DEAEGRRQKAETLHGPTVWQPPIACVDSLVRTWTSVRARRPSRHQLELEQAGAESPRLDATDLQLLTVGQHRDVRTAGHHIDLCEGAKIGQRPTPEPDETRGVQPRLQVLQPVRDRMPHLLHGEDVQQLAV